MGKTNEVGGTAVIHRPLTLEPPHGEVIRADLRLPEHDTGESAVIVYHGFKGFKDWGFFPYISSKIAQAGHAVLTFNGSRNGIGEHLLDLTELDRFANNTFSWELEDLLWIIDQVQSGDVTGSPPRSVGLLGHSRGGGSSVLAAAEATGLSALVTWASVSTFERWSVEQEDEWRRSGRIFIQNARTGQELPLDVSLLDDLRQNRERLDIQRAAAQVRSPWLVVHGDNDVTVSVDEARLLKSLSTSSSTLIVADAGHTFECGHPFERPSEPLLEVLAATISHFNEHLCDSSMSRDSE